MILKLLALSALLAAQDPPKPAAPVAPAPAIQVKVETMKRVGPDGVTLTGDYYSASFDGTDRPLVVCFHMEKGSRAEFPAIAQRFGEFACLTFAVDLRNGKSFDAVPNETAVSAASVLKKTEFTNEEAFADVVEALKWARELRPTGQIYALGSGTSAALVLAAAARNPACADALFLFSPAEDVAGWSIAMEAKKISVPTYITCDGTLEEGAAARKIGNSINKKLRQMVIPTGVPGAARGARILVQSEIAVRDRHWMSVVKMLLQLAPLGQPAGAETPLKQG